MSPRCNHRLVDGDFGLMGDCLVCAECGEEAYPEHWTPGAIALAKLQGRYVTTTHPDYAAHRARAVAARDARRAARS